MRGRKAVLESLNVWFEGHWICWRVLLPAWDGPWAPDDALRIRIVNALGGQALEEDFNWSSVWLHPADLDGFHRATLRWLDRQLREALGSQPAARVSRSGPNSVGEEVRLYEQVPAWMEQGFAYLEPIVFTRGVPLGTVG